MKLLKRKAFISIMYSCFQLLIYQTAIGSNAFDQAFLDSLYRKDPVKLHNFLNGSSEPHRENRNLTATQLRWDVKVALRLNEYGVAELYLEQLFKKNGTDKLTEAFCLSRLAYINFRNLNINSSNNFLKKAADIYKNYQDSNGLGYCKLVEGQISLHLQKRADALASFYEASHLVSLSELEHEVLLQMGRWHDYNNDTNKAEGFFLKAIELAKERNDVVAEAESYADIGVLMLKYQGERNESALNYFAKAKNIYQRLNLEKKIIVLYFNWGYAYEVQKDYDKALQFYQLALKLAQEQNYNYVLGELYNNIGNCYYKQQEDVLAVRNYLKSLSIANENDDIKMMADVCYNLHNNYKYLGELDSALYYLKEHLKLKDFILNEEKQRAIVELQTQYKIKETADSLEIQKRKAELGAMHLSKAKLQNKLFSGGTILFFLLALSIFLYLNQRIKHNRTKAQQQEAQNRQRILDLMQKNEIARMNAVMEGQDLERKRLSEELHDNLGSLLATVKLRFAGLGTKINGAAAAYEKEYDNAIDLLDDACREVRKISHNLVSGTVTEFGLVAAVKELASTIESSGTLHLKVIVNGKQRRLEQNQGVAVYRIVQELVGNIIKHSHATMATVSINYYPDSLNLIIEDNGVGFEQESVKTKRGFGLGHIRERAEALNGTVTIDTTPGTGTIILLDLKV